jgi:hypothetical protein
VWQRAGEKDFVINSPVVCIESEAPDGIYLKSAVHIGDDQYMLPPFCLISVVKIEEPGEWEYLPGKCMNQRLITIRPTFLTPFVNEDVNSNATNKFVTARTFLSFGNSSDVRRGLQEITHESPLTMIQEWARNDKWTDWKGRSFMAWKEYQYATGVVPPSADSEALRDAGHHGWSLDTFSSKINAQVRENASRKGLADVYELNAQEVIAIRLYTGPGFQPINEFLRETFKLSTSWRRKIAGDHTYTYAKTVCHLSDGLRKLARVNTKFGTVYRGVRGTLPEAFWLPDVFGIIAATDFGFMSTSLTRATAEDFLGRGEETVLWKIECSDESDLGFHSAADVSLLSQFPKEKEMLFPPLTMLQARGVKPGAGVGDVRRGVCESGTTTLGANYVCISVAPTFV